MTGFPELVELTLDHHLRGNACVVGPGLPQGSVPPHAVITDQGIHDGVLKGVAHMQTARHVWRGNRYAKGRSVTRRLESTLRFPRFVQGAFYGVRIVGFAEGFGAHRGIFNVGRKGRNSGRRSIG